MLACATLAAMPSWAQQAGQALPFKADKSAELPGTQAWALAILACALLLALLLFAAKRWPVGRWRSAGHDASGLRVVERTALSPGSQAIVLRYQQREMLLVVGQGYATCLSDNALVGADNHTPPKGTP